ncbi:MAG: RNA polymerase factor sigma-54 [SAR324 cluster bacterium]|nr:RNA polymerase factor sigma-54 [SAR324 cluster bacterium]
MAMQMKLQMRLSQQLIMTPQLQQAIKLLQLSRTELEDLVNQALIENPVLEESMDIDTFPAEEGQDLDSTENFDVVTEEPQVFESVREVEKDSSSTPEEIDWQQYLEFDGNYNDRKHNVSDDELPSFEATLTRTESLVDHLAWQLGMGDFDPLEMEVGGYLVGNINDDGYLAISIRELLESNNELQEAILEKVFETPISQWAEFPVELFDLKYKVERASHDSGKRKKKMDDEMVDEWDEDFDLEELDEDLDSPEPEIEVIVPMSMDAAIYVERILRQIQQFEPSGVGARSLQECLLIQLRNAGLQNDLSYQIVERDIELLESKDLKKIARRHKQDLEHVIEAYRGIMTLEPKPGRLFSSTPAHHYIVPDVYIYKSNQEYKVALNGQGIPRLRISHYYKSLADQMAEDGNLTKEYIQEKIKSGQWLMKSIEQRQKTIYRVTQSILKFQREFFDKGINYLKPLVLKDVAEDISVHESTVSRITTNKYVHTPQGIFELKYFFTSGIDQGEGGEAISSKRIKDMITQLVQSEDLKSPYTDLQIADILYQKSNIKVARRTVAKYREALNILPSNKRKQLF